MRLLIEPFDLTFGLKLTYESKKVNRSVLSAD